VDEEGGEIGEGKEKEKKGEGEERRKRGKEKERKGGRWAKSKRNRIEKHRLEGTDPRPTIPHPKPYVAESARLRTKSPNPLTINPRCAKSTYWTPYPRRRPPKPSNYQAISPRCAKSTCWTPYPRRRHPTSQTWRQPLTPCGTPRSAGVKSTGEKTRASGSGTFGGARLRDAEFFPSLSFPLFSIYLSIHPSTKNRHIHTHFPLFFLSIHLSPSDPPPAPPPPPPPPHLPPPLTITSSLPLAV
jgi:hypothetical protein